MNLLKIAAVATPLLASSVAYAQQAGGSFVSGKMLQQMCNDPRQEIACRSYIAGVSDTLSDPSIPAGSRVCIPVDDAAPLGHIMVSVRYDRANWENVSATTLVSSYLLANYKCSQNVFDQFDPRPATPPAQVIIGPYKRG